MKSLSRIAAISLFTVVALVYQSGAADKWPSTISVGSFSKGSTSYPVNVAIAKLIGKYTPVSAAVREYAGGAPGIEALIRGDVDTWAQGQTDFYEAYLGEGLWKGRPQDLRLLIGTVFEGPLGFGVRPSDGIHSIKDLAGKKVMSKSAIPYQNRANEAILRKAGVWDKVTHIQFASTGDIAPAMIEKTVDSFCWAIGGPYSLQIKESTGIDWISLTEEEADAVRAIPGLTPWKASGWILEMYGYPPDKVLRSYSYLFAVSARAEMSENVAYGIVKAVFDGNHLDEVRSLSQNLSATSLKTAVADFWVPFHPGAVKYYKEKGIWTAKMEARQKELLAMRHPSR